MDLSDPRKRLQVLQNQSPSLRVATTPTPQISVAKPQQQQVTVQQPQVKVAAPQSISFKGVGGQNFTVNPSTTATTQPTVPTPNRQSTVGKIGGFISAPFKPLGEGIARLLPGGQNDLKANQEAIDQLSKNQDVYTQLYKTGKINKDQYTKFLNSNAADFQAAGKEADRIGSTADRSQVVGSALMTAAAPFVGAADLAPTLAGKVGLGIAEGAGTGAANAYANEADPSAKSVVEQAGVGGAVGGMFPGLGAAGKKLLQKAGISFGGKAATTVEQLAATSSEGAVKKGLSKILPDVAPEVRDTISSYIAKEDNPQTIQQIISSVSGNTDDTLSFLNPSHPTQDWLNNNLPGTHVPGTADPVQVLSEKAKEFSNPIDFKRYVDGLQGDEKAVADAALNKTTADEFYGKVSGTKQDQAVAEAGNPTLPPEDVEAIKAAGGTPPPQLDADTVLHLPQQGVHAKLTKDQAAFLADENKNIPWSETDRPHLTAGDRVRTDTKEISQEELAKLSPNAGIALENADKQVPASVPSAKAVEDVSKAQTGTSDGQVTGSGETTNTGAAQGDIPSKVDEGTANATNTPETAENGSQGNLPQKATDIVPNADPETQKAVQEVLDNLNSAQGSYDEAAKLRTTEKGQRIGAGSGAYESAGGGEAGVKAKLGQLKGKYSESGFNPITASEGTQKTILDNIENSGLRDFEKLNTQQAMRKIWGSTEGKPTPSDINYIRKFFGEDMANSVQQAVDESPTGWRDKLAQIAGTPRALMATGDLSYGLRQGAPLGARFPKIWANAEKESAKYAVNTDYFNREMESVRNHDAYELITDKMKVQLPAADKGTEEAFAGADLAEKIPGAKHVVKGADRAYSGMATKLRFDAANQAVEAAGGPDAYLKVMQDTFGDKADEAMKAYGEVINTLSGRGGKAGGLVEQHMKTLSTTLFAPRLWAAKLNTLNPYWYARLAKSNPEAAKLAARANATFLTMAGGVLSAAAAAGADVEWDPRSADFAKIKVGNTRYDILGGLQQNIRLGAQLATGEKVNSETGELQTLGDGYAKPTRKDILLQAFEGKENPLLAYASKLLEGKDQAGNPINPVTEGAKLAIPLNAQGTYETAKDLGNGDVKSVAKGVGMNLPGVFGVGVQTYGQTATKDEGKDPSTGKLAFKGKVTPDMVLGDDGKPMLDGKGKPIKVTPPKTADGKQPKFTDLSPVEQKALLDSKKSSAKKDQFTQSQSADDQALMKLSDNQLKDYVKSGTIDQAKYDKIQRLQKGAGDFGQEIKADDGVKSEAATAFSKHFNSMDKKDQDYFLNKQGPDSTANTIATELNKSRSAGLDEYKPSNKLAQLYTKYEADINQHDGSVDGKDAYTDVDKRNKAKSFQTAAYKLNYDQEQNDIFTEGGSTDLKTLIDNKEIDKSDLDAAMKMDEQLYNSGLTGSLKFSKKFRESYGYTVPDGGTGPNGGQGSSTSDDVNAHLMDYLPTASASGSGSNEPTFSSKRRTTGISFKNVNLPSKSGKKISIKL